MKRDILNRKLRQLVATSLLGVLGLPGQALTSAMEDHSNEMNDLSRSGILGTKLRLPPPYTGMDERNSHYEYESQSDDSINNDTATPNPNAVVLHTNYKDNSENCWYYVIADALLNNKKKRSLKFMTNVVANGGKGRYPGGAQRIQEKLTNLLPELNGSLEVVHKKKKDENPLNDKLLTEIWNIQELDDMMYKVFVDGIFVGWIWMIAVYDDDVNFDDKGTLTDFVLYPGGIEEGKPFFGSNKSDNLQKLERTEKEARKMWEDVREKAREKIKNKEKNKVTNELAQEEIKLSDESRNMNLFAGNESVNEYEEEDYRLEENNKQNNKQKYIDEMLMKTNDQKTIDPQRRHSTETSKHEEDEVCYEREIEDKKSTEKIHTEEDKYSPNQQTESQSPIKDDNYKFIKLKLGRDVMDKANQIKQIRNKKTPNQYQNNKIISWLGNKQLYKNCQIVPALALYLSLQRTIEGN